MKHRLFALLLLCTTALLSTGCATVFKGYETDVRIEGATTDVRVFDEYGTELPLHFGTMTNKIYHKGTWGPTYVKVPDSSHLYIRIRSNRDHRLTVKDSVSEYFYYLYPKINAWWFALDILCGGIPALVDAYTGNWNMFDVVHYRNPPLRGKRGE